MATLAKLLVNLGLDSSEFKGGLSDASHSASKFGSVIGGVSTAAVVGLAGITTAAVGLGIAGVKAFVGFEKGMAEVFTLMPNASQDTFDAMTQDVKAFSMEFGVLPDKVIPGLYDALSSGVPSDNVFAFLETAQKAATAGVTDLSTTVNGITSVINAYGAETINATQASDQMFAAVVFGKTTFEELSNSLYNVNPIAASLGVSFGDVTSAIAAMTAQGIPTAQTTTQLRALMVELGDNTTEVGKKFNLLSGTSFKTFIENGGNVQTALQLLETHANGAGIGVNELFGSVEAGGAALSLTGKGTELFNNALAATAQSVGATDQAFGTMNQTLDASWQKILAAGSVFLVTIGEKLAPAVALFANALVTLLQSEKTAEFITKLGESFSALIGYIEPVVTFINTIDFSGLVKQLTPAIDSTIDRFKKMGDFIVTLFNQVKTFLDTNGGDIVKTFAQWTGQVIDIVNKAMVLLNAVIVTTLGAVTKFIDDHGTEIQTILGGTWEVIKNVISAALNIIQGVLTAALQIMSGDWAGAWETIKTMSAAVVLNLIGIITGGLNIIAGFFGTSMKGIVATWQNNWNMLVSIATTLAGRLVATLLKIPSQISRIGQDIVNGIRDGLSNGWGALVNYVQDLAQSLLDAAKSALGISSPSKAFADNVGVPIILGILQGLKAQAPNLMKWIRDDLGKKLVDALSSAIGMARSQLDIFKTLFSLNRSQPYQPLIDATEQLTAAGDNALVIAEKLFGKQAEIDFLIRNPLSDHIENTAALNKLYAEQSALLDENAAAQRNLARLSTLKDMATQAAQNQQNALTQIANEANVQYMDAQARATEMAKTNAKIALDWFNERKNQITELAELQKERVLSTDPAEQSMLDTQMQLLRGVIALEQEQQEAFININYPGGKDALGNDQIIAIILETLRRSGYQVDINYRTA